MQMQLHLGYFPTLDMLLLLELLSYGQAVQVIGLQKIHLLAANSTHTICTYKC